VGFTPVSEKSSCGLHLGEVGKNVDQDNTCVYVFVGPTSTGHYEPFEDISKTFDEYERKTGVDISVYVDTASGGFVAPFPYAKAGN